MTAPQPHLETAVELARLRTELHSTNESIKRIADSLDRTLRDHESRLRTVEATALAVHPLQDALRIQAEAVKLLTARVNDLDASAQREAGGRKALWALATLPTTGLLLAIAKGWL